MKWQVGLVLTITVLLVTFVIGAGPTGAQSGAPTMVSYQGQVTVGGALYHGTGYFKFALVNATGATTYWSNDGTSSGGSEPTKAVQLAVSNGLFNVLLGDTTLTNMLVLPASAFSATDRYLRVWFSTDAAAYTLLSPDRRIAAAPYALQADEAREADLLDGQHASAFYTQGGNSFGAVGRLGTNDNLALEIEVNNTRALRIEPNATSPNLIGGYSGNVVTTGAYGATIGGGGVSGAANQVTDNLGVVAGGQNNRAGDGLGTTGDRAFATVSGGGENSAGGYASTVSGGTQNAAGGSYGSVPGGQGNAAGGSYSFAAGRRAKANSAGCFVWADSTNADFVCNTANQFAVRATGGVNFQTDTAGVQVNGNTVWLQGGNSMGTVGTLGTNDGFALEIEVNNLRALRIEPDATSPNLIGGYSGNSVTTGAYGASIGGGGDSLWGENLVTDNYGTVSGGVNNQAGDNSGTTSDRLWATVGGGAHNSARGQYATVGGGWGNSANIEGSTVGGGYFNTANGLMATIGGGEGNSTNHYHATVGGGLENTSDGEQATVGGGGDNSASGSYATVSGGSANTASGIGATVSGGVLNLAQGNHSFAAGLRAKAYNAGCFVWGDNSAGSVTCDTDNRWVARASGGVVFFTNAGMTTGVQVAAGSGSWASVSDRNLKANVRAVEPADVLARVAAMPIATWNYTSQDMSIRHIGPMAQDFYAAFGVGEADTHITTIDADGVALAAIQGLYAENQALKSELAALETRLAALEQGARPPATGGAVLLWLLAGGVVAVASGGVLVWGRRRPGAVRPAR